MKYSITVKPNSKKGPLILPDPNSENSLIIYLREKPHDNAANLALIKILSDHFNCPKTSIKILSGKTSRHKIIEI